MAARELAFTLLTLSVLGISVPSAAQNIGSGNTVSLAHQPYPKGNPRNWVTNKDFPASAKGESGTTQFSLQVDATGQIIACDILASSGFADLDQATCSLMRERGRFVPATDEFGKPIAGTHVQAIHWGRG
jgi:TonB family protein